MELSLINKHWKEDFWYGFPKRRAIFPALMQSVGQRFIVTLIGLRRTGKTTLMKQLIDSLIHLKVPRHSIWFYTFDEPATLQDVLSAFQKNTSKDLEKEIIYLFLDEIQKLEDWQNQVKIFYDHFPNIKFFISGSSSLFIRKKSESLAGRVKDFHLSPLSFSEYLYFREKKNILEKPEMFSAEISQEFEMYSQRQFVEIIDFPLDSAVEYAEMLARKIVFEDIPSVYPIEQPGMLWRWFEIISSQPGMLLDYHNVSSDLGINEKTLANYTDFLENAFLAKRIYNYSSNLITSEKKLKKIYPSTSSFCKAEITKVVETTAITQLKSDFFWRVGQEVDCVLVESGKALPIEIKYQDKIKEKELAGLKKFLEKFVVEKGIVLTKNYEEEKEKISFRPLWKFLLEREKDKNTKTSINHS